jgi:RsiW-degrading membrane proteinase PrsW (M82 family)
MPAATAILLAACSVGPVAVVILWLWFRDRLREPVGVVLATLGLGVLIAVPAIVLQTGLMMVGEAVGVANGTSPETLVQSAFTAFVVAAVVEEFLKFAVLWWFAARRDAFDEPMDGIVYGAAASLGFAAIENVLYVFGQWSSGGGAGGAFGLALVRALTAVPTHASCGVIMGACIGVARFTPGACGLWIALGLAGAIGVHGVYNFGIFGMGAMDAQDSGIGVGASMLAFLTALGCGIVLSVLALARLRRDQEVAMAGGNLPPTVAPRLPMAAAIMSAASVACMAVVLASGVAVARGQAQAEPMGEAATAVLGVVAVAAMLVSLLLALGAGVVGIVALVAQPRWRGVSLGAVVAAGLVLVAYGVSAVVGTSAAGG